jgi:hypothetical protein
MMMDPKWKSLTTVYQKGKLVIGDQKLLLKNIKVKSTIKPSTIDSTEMKRPSVLMMMDQKWKSTTSMYQQDKLVIGDPKL